MNDSDTCNCYPCRSRLLRKWQGPIHWSKVFDFAARRRREDLEDEERVLANVDTGAVTLADRQRLVDIRAALATIRVVDHCIEVR